MATFTRDKKFKYGTYRYQVISRWDKKLKKMVKKSNYLGKVDISTGELIPKKNSINKQEKSILDYGDTAVLNYIIKHNKLSDIINKSFPAHFDSIISLIFYQIVCSESMVHANTWFEGNFVNKLYPNANLSSQNISNILKYLSRDKNIDTFFKVYTEKFFPEKRGILIHSSAFSNSSTIELNNWGYNDGKIDKNISCIMLVDQITKLPIYFRPIAGNISDVSVLKQSFHDLDKLNLKADRAIFDAGFYSEDNLRLLINSNINFITRVPKNRKIFTNLASNSKSLQKSKNAVKYNKRGLFIEEFPINQYDTKLYAYLILDPRKQGIDISRLIVNQVENGVTSHDNDFDSKGVFMLLSSKKLDIKDVLPFYYVRQDIEVIFNICKNKTNMLTIRRHCLTTCKGFMFLCFLAIICYVLLKEKMIDSEFNVTSILLNLRNLKSKVYYDGSTSVMELNKKQKKIFEILDFKGA